MAWEGQAPAISRAVFLSNPAFKSAASATATGEWVGAGELLLLLMEVLEIPVLVIFFVAFWERSPCGISGAFRVAFWERPARFSVSRFGSVPEESPCCILGASFKMPRVAFWERSAC